MKENAKDSEDKGELYDKPPSVPQELWDPVPSSLRDDFVVKAAIGLRRGIHPIDTFERLLKENGIKPGLKKENLSAGLKALKKTGKPSSGRDTTRGRSGNQNGRRNASRSYPVPLDGFRELMSGKGITPDQIEENVFAIFKAIDCDPVLAFWSPKSVCSLLPATLQDGLEKLVTDAAQRLVDYRREQKAKGVAEAMAFMDPDDWSFALDDLQEPAQ